MKGVTLTFLAVILVAGTAIADSIGPVTNRPLPRFVSMKAGEANVRRGPSMTHRIDWVFKHRGMPLVVTAEYGHWRLVRDRDGMGGWVHYAMLSGTRTAQVVADSAEIVNQPLPGSQIIARAERGAVLRIKECGTDWCRVSSGGHRGWVKSADLWGATIPGDAD